VTRSELLKTINDTLADVVDDPDLKITEASTTEDVADWDSINHVRLIVALERELGIRFDPDEISDLPNVGALIDVIERLSA
jgi:acyl carrier protein